jgi:ABC-type uncharacterized transport system permease subunit
MVDGISVFCFAASYSVALVLELTGLKVRFGWHRVLMLAFAVAGLVAHTWYLWNRAAVNPSAPLATAFDWCLLAAWALAVVYLALVFYFPRTAIGLFVLPLALLLVGLAQLASRANMATDAAPRFWSLVHAGALLLGTVTVCVGFLAGLMYLVQSYRLKRALPAGEGFRLPSLEWLEHINSRSLGVSAVMIAVGFVSGVVLSRIRHEGEADYQLWFDPAVLSVSAMLGWLLVAEGFRLLYPAARQGQKVAYLTLAAFVFLVFMLGSLALLESTHNRAPTTDAAATEIEEAAP